MTFRGPPLFKSAWETIWRPFLVKGNDGSDIEVLVTEVPWGFRISGPSRALDVTDPWRALIESRNEAIISVLDAISETLQVHAAVVAKGDRALLLVGDSWAGKTTVSLELLRSGWHYFSDDVALIDSSGMVRPFPKPPAIKSRTWEVYAHHWKEWPSALGVPEGPFLIPPPFTGALADRARPTMLSFLRYEEEAVPTLRPVSPGAAAVKIGRAAGPLDAALLGQVAELCRECVSYELVYGDADLAAALIDQETSSIYP